MFGELRLSERNLILTGYTGPNQPAVGQTVADRLRLRFIDVEQYLEARVGESADSIRSLYGEQRLKSVINEVMEEIILHRNSLIRVNGGMLLAGDHFQQLQSTGPVICLVARLDAILRRLHLTLGARYHDPAQRAVALGQLKREWSVRKLAAIYELDVTYLDTEQTISAITSLWQEVAITRG